MRWPNGESETVIIGIGLKRFEDAEPSTDGSCLSDEVTAVFIRRWSSDSRKLKSGRLLEYHVLDFDTTMTESELWRNKMGPCKSDCKVDKLFRGFWIVAVVLVGLVLLVLVVLLCRKCCSKRDPWYADALHGQTKVKLLSLCPSSLSPCRLSDVFLHTPQPISSGFALQLIILQLNYCPAISQQRGLMYVHAKSIFWDMNSLNNFIGLDDDSCKIDVYSSSQSEHGLPVALWNSFADLEVLMQILQNSH